VDRWARRGFAGLAGLSLGPQASPRLAGWQACRACRQGARAHSTDGQDWRGRVECGLNFRGEQGPLATRRLPSILLSALCHAMHMDGTSRTMRASGKSHGGIMSSICMASHPTRTSFSPSSPCWRPQLLAPPMIGRPAVACVPCLFRRRGKRLGSRAASDVTTDLSVPSWE